MAKPSTQNNNVKIVLIDINEGFMVIVKTVFRLSIAKLTITSQTCKKKHKHFSIRNQKKDFFQITTLKVNIAGID